MTKSDIYMTINDISLISFTWIYYKITFTSWGIIIDLKKIFMNKKLAISFLIALVIFNVILIIITLINIRSGKRGEVIPSISTETSNVQQANFFDLTCPEIEMYDIQGQSIRLADFAGRVIAIRFTRFHPQDLPYLIYLEPLFKKFQHEGFYLIFINLLGKQYSTQANKLINFSVPLIEDDGYIAALFNARLNDLIIIGRDFRIKFKHNQVGNRIIYNQVARYLFEDSKPPPSLSKKDLNALLKNISYVNIENKKIENIGVKTKGKPSIITLATSHCFTCPEHQKIQLIKEVALISKINKEQNVLLFGKGNDSNWIREFSIKNELYDYITIGIIEDSENLSDQDYYRMFDLKTDPRIFVFNKKGEIEFAEELKDQTKLNVEFLLREVS